MFEPHPWIKRRACSRSWAVAPVLQYFRALRGDFANMKKKKTKKKNRKKHAKALIRSIIRSFFRVFWQKNQRREALGQKIWVRVGKLGPKCPAPEDRGACENKKTDQKKRKKHAMTLIRSIIRSFFRVFWPKKKKNGVAKRWGRKSGSGWGNWA